jgi:hypothetical protein
LPLPKAGKWFRTFLLKTVKFFFGEKIPLSGGFLPVKGDKKALNGDKTQIGYMPNEKRIYHSRIEGNSTWRAK